MRASLIVLATVASGAANAADSQTENRLRDALRQATAQLRSLEDEKARLQATEAAQKTEIDALKAKLDAESRKSRGPSSEVTRRLEEQAEANQKLTSDLAQCQAAARESTEAATAKDAEREQMQAKQAEEVSQATKRASACEDKNSKMYQLSHELLTQCEHMSLGDTLMAPFEPITGLRKAKLENLFQDYEDKLLDQKANPGS